MLLRILLSLVILFPAAWSQTVIEYGGISFECYEDLCADPEKDPVAKRIGKIYEKSVSWGYSEIGYLRDDTDKWRNFEPFHGSCSDDPFVYLDRYEWERVGVTDISGEYDYSTKTFTPADLGYFSSESYPISQQGLIEVFNRMRADLRFYADLRFKRIQQRIAIQNEQIDLYRRYLASGYTHFAIENGRLTNPVRQDQFSEENWVDDYYREIGDEIDLKEAEIRNLSEYKEKVSRNLSIYLKWFDDDYAEIDPLLKEIFTRCLTYHQPEGIAFNGAVEALLANDFPEALACIRALLAVAEETDFSPEEMSKIYLLQGQLESEFCLHGDAIVSLTEAIARNPSSQEAYLERAAAHFELGQFDRAIADYRMLEGMSFPSDFDYSEFAKGFVLGAASGFGESVRDFIPNTLSSLRGMGHFLWATLQHPIETPRAMMIHALEIFAKLRECSPYELTKLAIPELDHLVQEWNQVTDFARGQQIGLILGKYGTEMLTPLAIHKGAAFLTALQDLKKCEKLQTLKALSDVEKRSGILEGSAQVMQNRQGQLSKIKIEWDKQNKHVPGKKNFEEGKSLFTHPDAQGLVDQFAGKGQRRGPIEQGAGYKEKVDFGVTIGQTKVKGELVDTSWGIIHYSKTGAHIVPAGPDN